MKLAVHHKHLQRSLVIYRNINGNDIYVYIFVFIYVYDYENNLMIYSMCPNCIH